MGRGSAHNHPHSFSQTAGQCQGASTNAEEGIKGFAELVMCGSKDHQYLEQCVLTPNLP